MNYTGESKSAPLVQRTKPRRTLPISVNGIGWRNGVHSEKRYHWPVSPQQRLGAGQFENWEGIGANFRPCDKLDHRGYCENTFSL